MAIPTSIAVTINAVPYTLLRINQDGNTSKYYLRNGGVEEFTINIRHQNVKATATRASYDRHNLELIHHVFPNAVGPIVERTRQIYTVFTNDVTDTDVNFGYFAAGYDGMFDTTMVTALLGWQV
jgi:hypothetical protein